MSVDELLADLKDVAREKRRAAAEELGYERDIRAVEPLIEALGSDEDMFTRQAAALSLGRLGDGRALGPLLEVLQPADAHPGLMVRAATALGDLGDQTAIDVLTSLAQDSAYDLVRKAATDALEVLAGGHRRPTRPDDLEGSARETALALKGEYRQNAIDWWAQGTRTEANCDDCNKSIPQGEGYARPGYLACERCTDKMVSGYYS